MKRFDLLDGLRGLAALFVVTCHVAPFNYTPWAKHVYLAVDFFFVLSGFVLAYGYEDKLTRKMSILEFMARRLIRLWPMYTVGLALGAVAALAGGDAVPGVVGASLLGLPMIPTLFTVSGGDLDIYPLNYPAWSLFYELFANLIFALVARRLSNRLLVLILAVGLGLLALGGRIDVGVGAAGWPFAIGRVTFSFFAGVAAFRLWRSKPSTLTPTLTPALLTLLAVVGLMAIFMLPWPWLSIVLVSPMLVYLAASTEPRGLLRRLCACLGTASYGVYVMHQPLSRLWGLALSSDGGRKVLVLTGLSAFALALLLEGAFDRPVREWLSGRLLKHRVPSAA